MKILTTLVCWIIILKSNGQPPTFTENLSSSQAFVCYDGSLVFNCKSLDASEFQFQRKNNITSEWANVASGIPAVGTGQISQVFSNIIETITVRVIISKNGQTAYSNEVGLHPQRPSFNFQPLDITQCNGLGATFRVSVNAEGSAIYQWQESTNGGGSYSTLSNTTKYGNTASPSLSVNTLTNTDDGKKYRCFVRDQKQCESFSNPASLFVNQLSTAVSPTTTTKFCEGDTAKFSVALKVGEVSNMQWQMKLSAGTSYTDVAESTHFEDVNSDILKVNRILPSENSYRLNVNFVSKGQGTDGLRTTGTCLKTATRASYIINPRPTAPTQIDDIYRCGTGKINASVSGSGPFFWYSDTLKAPITSNSAAFSSPTITLSTPYFYSKKDVNLCESSKRTFNAIIRPLPTQTFEKTFSICPTENKISLNFSANLYNPTKISVLKSTNPLAGFSEINLGVYSSPFDVDLPIEKANGTYNFKVFSKNEFCYSDTSTINLTVKKATKTIESPASVTICEGNIVSFSSKFEAEQPVQHQWFKDNAILLDSVRATLSLKNITPNNDGKYFVKAIGQCGEANSNEAKLTILPKTAISVQPTNKIVCENSAAEFSIEANGSGILHYQWYQNDQSVGSDSKILNLTNILLADHNSNIKCKITSDCAPDIFSETVKLLVDDLPAVPNISTEIGFCKSPSAATLRAQSFPKHTLKWYNSASELLPSNQFNVSIAQTVNLFVNQVDTNGCESQLKPFQLVVSEPFTIAISADVNALCSTGLFNRTGNIETEILTPNFTASDFKLYKNDILNASNTNGAFEISGGAYYKVKASKAYCTDSASISINSLFPELNQPLTVTNAEVCKGNSASISANSSYSGGKYIWWESPSLPFQLAEGKDFMIANVQYSNNYFVSYSKTSGNVFCETDRILASIKIKSPLKMSLVKTEVSCDGRQDGGIKITALTGASPIIFTLNGVNSNQTGLFGNLSTGVYNIHIVDADGCFGDSTLNLGLADGAKISSQPVNISRCKGNIANFTVAASNYDQLIWERKLPNENTFSEILGESLQNLRIENIGSPSNPHLTIFRAKISKNQCIIYTHEVTLFVNSIIGTGSPISACVGDSKTVNLSNFTVIGPNQSIQWQYRAGTTGSFVDLSGKTNSVLAFENMIKANEGYYRCKVAFDNGNGNTCLINTSTSGIKLTVDTPEIPILGENKAICKGQSTSISASSCSGTLIWVDGSIGNTITVNPIVTSTYTATCKIGSCNTISNSSLTVTVLETPIGTPTISVNSKKYCIGDSIKINASNCVGQTVWSNSMLGNTISVIANVDFQISAVCKTEFCSSPQSNEVSIKVNPVLTSGQIATHSGVNCAGYNPSTIASVSEPSGGKIQWQKSENCEATSPIWTNIVGETGTTFNPPALLVTTCYRRMVSDSCNLGLFSNISTFDIRPDPSISVSADKESVCFGSPLNLSKTVVGGEGICSIQWQINKISSSVSSTFWTNLSVADALVYANSGSDSTFYFRAKVDCSNNSCNLATSNVVSAVFHPKMEINVTFADSTICAGASINLVSTSCKGQILWSTGATTSQISVSPTANTIYKVACKNDCEEVFKNIVIAVVPGIEPPTISIAKNNFCQAEDIKISASNCLGEIIWSNAMKGTEIHIPATSNFSISAHCNYLKCQSLETSTLSIKVNPVLTSGQIATHSGVNCAGYNPSTISSISDPSGGKIQWQKSENCEATSPIWANIVGETGTTFNPPALLVTTCYRRMVSDSCNLGLFSNISTFDIRPDPSISVSADKESVCFGSPLNLSKTVVGGEGICSIQWQINKVSSSVSSTFWTNLSVADALVYANSNSGTDSTFYFRAKVDCSNSSCNLATSNVVSAVFHPKMEINVTFADSTICAGASINLVSTSCKGQILWSTGATTSQISVSPTANTIYKVACKNDCEEVFKNINITVIAGIEPPTISIAKNNFCQAEDIKISASNCLGEIIWSNAMKGTEIHIPATSNFSISAHCNYLKCQSLETSTLSIKVNPVLTSGQIATHSGVNCAGYNPSTISSISDPSGGKIQWQKSENCEATSPIWANIAGETGTTFNPPALLVTTCYRRMVSDSCNLGLFSNISTFDIRPDPSISVSADKESVCFGSPLNLSKTVVGGEGICSIQWQINKVSSSVSSTFWTNLSVADALVYTNSNSGTDSTFYFRAKVDCSNSSCNLATSNVVSAVFHPKMEINVTFADSTICAGASINLVSTSCKGQILWSTGATKSQISVSPTANTIYKVACKNDCEEVFKNINITVIAGIELPTISIAQNNFCQAEDIKISASNCLGEIIWSNGMKGTEIHIPATSNFSISAHCNYLKCQSLETSTLSIKVNPVLTSGQIATHSGVNCAGYNPSTIASVSEPSGGKIQWQKSENCEATSPIWANIAGETGTTFNPPALLVTTCYRRMVSDSCNLGLFSNISTFDIRPDPSISVSADKESVCFGSPLNLSKTVVGGEGICSIQWQINKVSSSVSSTFWTNLSVADALVYTNSNSGTDSTFYFRAKVDCSNSSCNLATSNVVSAVFHPKMEINVTFADSTICAGASINLVSTSCKGQILWSTGATTSQISVSPTANTIYKVACKNDCEEVFKNINITVIAGIELPTISIAQNNFCQAEDIKISASNCLGEIIWSNGMKGTEIHIPATSNFSISAHCNYLKCQSLETSTLSIKVNPVLTSGQIATHSGVNCAGYNPSTIASVSEPSGGKIQWQKSENCEATSPIWANIAGETGTTFNPPALLVTTCYRRMVSDSCNLGLFSNISTFDIRPDPSISVSADKESVCFGSPLNLSKTVVGGEGICSIQWQINKVSSSVSSTFWTNLSVADALVYANSNSGSDSTFYFRAKVDCSNSSCNLATSNVVSAVFHPKMEINVTFADSTICAGASINLVSTSCKGQILWSTGATTSQISVSPTANTIYKVACKNDCEEVFKNINITVIAGIELPTISIAQNNFCQAEDIKISASNCLGEIIWSNGMKGTEIHIPATSNFSISAHCNYLKCQSLETSTLSIKVNPVLTSGQIATHSGVNCAGYNPSTIASVSEPSGGKIQWQKSENCEATSPIWANIAGETGTTFNPPALLVTTCYRRMVSDSCNLGLFSNISTFDIRPDPSISVSADKESVCFGSPLNLSKTVVGGEGICSIQWQINKVSSSVSSTFWTNLSVADALVYANSNSGSDSTFYFRAKVDCSNSSCNLATSNVVSATFHPKMEINVTFADSTICAGASINLVSTSCKGQILWSTGATTSQISVSPTANTIYKVSCKNDCEEVFKNINITVIAGIEPPKSSTPDSVLAPNILIFSAGGEKLKWYQTSTAIISLNLAPSISAAGTYTFWVSQTIGFCESARIPITAKLIAALKISVPLISQTNCYGNTSNFTIQATGAGTLSYQWMRKLPNEASFSTIPIDNNYAENANTATLKIKSVGNESNPHLTEYKCVVKDNNSQLTSNIVTLNVNRVQGSLANQKRCLGNDLVLNLNNSHQITGNPLKIQWQQRPGTGSAWLDMNDSLNITGTKTLSLNFNDLQLSNQNQYRCTFTFNATTGTCIETTDLMTLTIGEYPLKPSQKEFEFCQNETSVKLDLKEPNDIDVVWYTDGNGNSGSTTQPKISTSSKGDYVIYYTLKNTFGCESEKALVQYKIQPEPNKPTNTTPIASFENEILKFTAIGEQLKWYTSRTGKTFVTSNPTYTKLGKYDHYVSQTNVFGCESDRLLIESEIVASFGITTQPINQANCKDNTVTFSIKTKGVTNPKFQWQKKNPLTGIFEDISNQNAVELRIPDVGKAPYLDSTIYRCAVSNGTNTILSNEALLRVHNIESELSNIVICENTPIDGELFKTKIIGNPTVFEWQKKEGTSYPTVFTTNSISENVLPTISGDYRLRITFRNQGPSTCVRTSNNFKIEVNKKPEAINTNEITLCQFSKIQNLLDKLPINVNLKNVDSSDILEKTFPAAISKNYIVQAKSDKGCMGKWTSLKLRVNPAPDISFSHSNYSFCRFSESEKYLKINDLNTIWFQDESDEDGTENTIKINTNLEREQYVWASVIGQNGCQSLKKSVRLQITDCLFDLKTDTCISLVGRALLPNEWNYFYEKNGKIFAAVHPQGQDLGNVSLDFKNSASTLIKDLNQNEFYPRYFNFQSSKSFSKDIKIRFYMSESEIIAFGKTLSEEVLLVNYSGENQDCDLINNTLGESYWIEGSDFWQQSSNSNFKYTEFSTTKIGEFGLWNQRLPLAFISANLGNTNLPQLRINEINPIGSYSILKSKDGKNWFEWLPKVEKTEFEDLKPFITENYYQLIYDFGNGIKAKHNVVKVSVPETIANCLVFENPTENRAFLKMYFPNLDKSTIMINTATGQHLQIKSIIAKDDYFEIYPGGALSHGFHVIYAKNFSGKTCSAKIWVR